MNKQGDFYYRFQPRTNTPDYLLLKYLESTADKNQLVLKVIRMCFLPYAYQEEGLKKGQSLKKIAQEMIWSLETWIEQIRVTFGVERTVATYQTSALLPVSAVGEGASEVFQEESEDLVAKWAGEKIDVGGL